jgi:hypothetical protein
LPIKDNLTTSAVSGSNGDIGTTLEFGEEFRYLRDWMLPVAIHDHDVIGAGCSESLNHGATEIGTGLSDIVPT